MRYLVLSATFGKSNKQNMFKLILYIQVKSLVADTVFTCIYKYTINKYCIKCVSYRNKSLIYKISLNIFCLLFFPKVADNAICQNNVFIQLYFNIRTGVKYVVPVAVGVTFLQICIG